MTADENSAQRRRTIDMVVIGVTAILLVALFLGEHLLSFFGITIDSFRVGGGILVLLMAIAMLHAKTSLIKQTDSDASESIEKESVAIVPLAMPLLAGPGAISTVILAAHHAHSVMHYMMIALGIVLLSVGSVPLVALDRGVVSGAGGRLARVAPGLARSRLSTGLALKIPALPLDEPNRRRLTAHRVFPAPSHRGKRESGQLPVQSPFLPSFSTPRSA